LTADEASGHGQSRADWLRDDAKLVEGSVSMVKSEFEAPEQTYLTVDQGVLQCGSVGTIGGGRAIRGFVEGRHVDLR